uniref:Keratin n=1 Tax=Gopherus agassizii TaxID=38772 RepID=A0A452GMP3_9SAUR
MIPNILFPLGPSFDSSPCCAFQVYLHPRKITLSSLCYPECGVARPWPVTGACNQPCVRQCPDSELVIRPSLVVVTHPGPILSNFSQHSAVGAVGAPAIRPGFGCSFGWVGYGGRYGGWYGLGGYGGYGSPYGYWGHGGYLGDYGYGGICGSGVSCHRYLSGSCGPC